MLCDQMLRPRTLSTAEIKKESINSSSSPSLARYHPLSRFVTSLETGLVKNVGLLGFPKGKGTLLCVRAQNLWCIFHNINLSTSWAAVYLPLHCVKALLPFWEPLPPQKKKGQPFLPSPRESVDKPINEIKVSESLPEAEPCLFVMGEINLNQTSSRPVTFVFHADVPYGRSMQRKFAGNQNFKHESSSRVPQIKKVSPAANSVLWFLSRAGGDSLISSGSCSRGERMLMIQSLDADRGLCPFAKLLGGL